MTDSYKANIASNPYFIQYLKKKRMHRIVFSSISLFLYAIFAFGYGPLYGLFISEVSEQSQLNFALLYFLFLVVAFFVLEFIYTKLANGMESDIRQVLHQAEHNNEL